MKQILLVLLIPLVFGCASAARMNRVNVGMTKQEVIKVLGKPASTSASEAVEHMAYGFVRSRMLFRSPYFVKLVDGKVTAYGPGRDKRKKPK